MKTETVNLADLRPPPRNVRVHPEKQITELARSVEMFGQTRPLVIDETGVVLVGNGLLSALKKLEWETASALRINGLSENDKRKLMLSDNKLYTLGIDDYDAIMDLVRELDDDLTVPGFDEELLRRFTVEVEQATAQGLGDFGRMTEGDVQQAAARTIPAGSPDADTSQPVVSKETVCPRCGHVFEP